MPGVFRRYYFAPPQVQSAALATFTAAPTGPTTHATSGVLTGQIGSVAGTAAHVAVHTTTGVLTGPGSTIAGSAARTREHATSGVLTGQLGSLAGSATRFRALSASGAIVGPGSILAASAVHNALHTSSGVLASQIGSVAGPSARAGGAVTHTASGTLVGQDSALIASASIITARADLIGRRRRRGAFSDYGIWRDGLG